MGRYASRGVYITNGSERTQFLSLILIMNDISLTPNSFMITIEFSNYLSPTNIPLQSISFDLFKFNGASGVPFPFESDILPQTASTTISFL